MRVVRTLAAAACLCAAVPLATCGGQSPPPPPPPPPLPLSAAVSAQAADLLGRSPALAPSMSVVLEAQYVRDVREALEGTGWEFSGTTALEATAALERALAGRIVTANVRSVPAGVVVYYRRLVDRDAPALTITSNDSLRLEPATYVFWATAPGGGSSQEQRHACVSGCTVTFVFEREP